MAKDSEDRKTCGCFFVFLVVGEDVYMNTYIYILVCVCCFLAVLVGASGMCIFVFFSGSNFNASIIHLPKEV